MEGTESNSDISMSGTTRAALDILFAPGTASFVVIRCVKKSETFGKLPCTRRRHAFSGW